MLSRHVAQLAADHQFTESSAKHHSQATEQIETGYNGHQEEPAPEAHEDLLVEYIQWQDAQIIHNAGRPAGPKLEHLALGYLGENLR